MAPVRHRPLRYCNELTHWPQTVALTNDVVGLLIGERVYARVVRLYAERGPLLLKTQTILLESLAAKALEMPPRAGSLT